MPAAAIIAPRLSGVTVFQIENFDALPDSTLVPLPVVCAVRGISPATVWRRVKENKLPHPRKDGNCTRWVVGELRACA